MPTTAEPPGLSAEECARRLFQTAFEMGQTLRLRDPFGVEDGTAMTPAQRHALLWVGRKPGITMSGLAGYLHTTTASTTGLVDRLVRDGWIERERGEEDRRLVRLRLTAAGRERSERIQRQTEARVVAGLEYLSEADRAALVGIIERAKATVAARHAAREGAVAGGEPAAEAARGGGAGPTGTGSEG